MPPGNRRPANPQIVAAATAAILMAFVASSAVIGARGGNQRRIPVPAYPDTIGSKLSPPPAPPVREVAQLSADKHLRCRARMSSTSHAGWVPNITVTMENPSKDPVAYSDVFAVVMVTDIKGIVLAPEDDTVFGHNGPNPEIHYLDPHAEVPVAVFGTPQVRWTGDIAFKVRCQLPQPVPLPALIVNVPQPEWHAPDVTSALDRALGTRRGLLDKCRPAVDGRWVTGELTAPANTTPLPPLTARCSADIQQKEGFDVVSMRVVVPADAPTFDFPDEPLGSWVIGSLQTFPGTGSAAAMRWTVVVLKDQVYDDQRTEAASRSAGGAPNAIAPLVVWHGLSWRISGSAGCSGSSNVFAWITYCKR